MSARRLAVAAAAALGASALSFGPPGARAPSRLGGSDATTGVAAPPAAIAAEAERRSVDAGGEAAPWPPAGLREVEAPAPADVRVEVADAGGGGARVTVTRRGQLVSLRHRAASSTGKDWAAIELRAGAGAGPTEDALVWEATDLQGLETARGFVHLAAPAGAGALPAARVALAEAPARGAADRTALRTCASHDDGAGGFVVICRFRREARSVRAVNVTGARPLEGIWVGPAGERAQGEEVAARLELPRAPGGAEARAIGYVNGLAGVVLRVEATWPEGDEAALLLSESRRAQPVSPFGGAIR